MLKFITLFLHLIRMTIMLTKPNGVKVLMAENLMLRKQLIRLSRKHQRLPKLSFIDRITFAILTHFIKSNRLIKCHRDKICNRPEVSSSIN